MKIIVFGATSDTGVHVVQQALEDGHAVTAFVRTPSKLTVEHSQLDVVKGDALNADDVVAAVEGHDAVISLIGPAKGSPQNVSSRSTDHIIDAMQRHGVRRLVVASVAGIPVPRDNPGLATKLITGLLRLILPGMFVDRERQLDLLRESDLDWVALRLPRLTDEAPTGEYHLGYMGFSPTMAISRADLATAMLDQLQDDTYLQQAPKITQ